MSGWTEMKAPKLFLKQKLHKKKAMVTVWVSKLVENNYSCFNPSETIITEKYCYHIKEMHQKLRLQAPAISAEKDLFFSMTTPVFMSDV